MPRYVLVYHGALPVEDATTAVTQRSAFGSWLQGLGDAVLVAGVPFTENVMVEAAGVTEAGADRTMGYTVVEAEDLDAAVSMARSSPFLHVGRVEVAHAGAHGA